jgi:hypothetical protein
MGFVTRITRSAINADVLTFGLKLLKFADIEPPRCTIVVSFHIDITDQAGKKAVSGTQGLNLNI